MEAAVSEIAEGRYKIEDRALLRLYTDSKVYSDFNYALNEIAVLKQDSSAMITIHASQRQVSEHLSGRRSASGHIDRLNGLLHERRRFHHSAAGLQLHHHPGMLHSLNVRPLIVPDDWEIELQIESRNNHFLIALDGRNNVFDTNTKLKIKKAAFHIKSIKRENNDFFNTLRTKLMWGVDNRKYTI